MLGIFSSGKVNLGFGCKLVSIKIKKDYDKLLELYSQDPNEFKMFSFLEEVQKVEAINAFKQFSNANSKSYFIYDNNLIVGVANKTNQGTMTNIMVMADSHYEASYAFKLTINHFMKKAKASNQYFIMMSQYDTNTLNELAQYGFNSHYGYVANLASYQFIGSDIENIGEEDWASCDENISLVHFFSSNWQGQVVQEEQEQTQDQENTYEFDPNSNVENSEDIEFIDDESEAENEDVIEINENDEDDEVIPVLPKGEGAKKEEDNPYNELLSITPSSSPAVNSAKVLKQISLIPENEHYSKVNSELYRTIKATPTFKDFEDLTIRESKIRKEKKSQQNEFGPGASKFKLKLEELRQRRMEVESVDLSFPDNKSKVPAYSKSKYYSNKNDASEVKPRRKGFGSHTIVI